MSNRKHGKADWKTYDKINKYLAFKYGTTYANIIRVRSFYGENNHKMSLDWMSGWGSKKACGALTPEDADIYESFVNFVDTLDETKLKDINKYWARYDSRLLF